MISETQQYSIESVVNNLISHAGKQYEKLVAYLDYGEATYTFVYYLKSKGRYRRYDIFTAQNKIETGKFFERIYQELLRLEEDSFRRKVVTVIYDAHASKYRVEVDESPDFRLGYGFYLTLWIDRYLK